MKYGIRGLVVLGLMMVNFPSRSLPAIASSPPSYVAQSIVGECRAARQGTFIYYERSADSGKIRALQTDDQVTLAGNGGDGWIAVDEPMVGFVPTGDLKPCTTQRVTLCASVGTFIYDDPSTGSRTIRSVLPNQPVVVIPEPREGWYRTVEPLPGFIQQIRLRECDETSSPVPPVSRPGSTANRGLCHRVTSLVNPGLNVRSRPTEAATVIDTLAPRTLIRLQSTMAQIDSTGRSWVRIISPVSGWVSDGFPGNQSNLRPVSCPMAR